jgi:hypothetical protein
VYAVLVQNSVHSDKQLSLLLPQPTNNKPAHTGSQAIKKHKPGSLTSNMTSSIEYVLVDKPTCHQLASAY